MLSYVEAKRIVTRGLSADIDAHGRGDFEHVGGLFDQCDGYLPRESGAEFKKLFIALGFWDAWIYVCDENWEHFPTIAQADWPSLAVEILQCLDADEEIDNPRILAYFDVVNRDGLWHRARGLLY